MNEALLDSRVIVMVLHSRAKVFVRLVRLIRYLCLSVARIFDFRLNMNIGFMKKFDGKIVTGQVLSNNINFVALILHIVPTIFVAGLLNETTVGRAFWKNP